MPLHEYNFDGLVGNTHNYAGLSPGNVASTVHSGETANPKAAALQGLAKMRFVSDLGIKQAVLPPHPRPSLRALRRLGFIGSDEEVVCKAATQNEHLLRLCSSASAMWAANAATVAPSEDAGDRRVHITPANLQEMFHRAIEAETTFSIFGAIFPDAQHYAIHEALPGGGQFADEGAANHLRLVSELGAVHLFAWGRTTFAAFPGPQKFPARQTFEASQAIARLHQLDPARCLFPQQSPEGIDSGAFHTDVLAVGTESFLMFHERAFTDPKSLLAELRRKLGDAFRYVLATEAELPALDAVNAYPFNSQLLLLPDQTMAILAPQESHELGSARAFLERVVAENNPVRAIHYLDVRQSMNNGGGPACLRLRVWLSDDEAGSMNQGVIFTPELDQLLLRWVHRYYRDALAPSDLADPQLARESMEALDELTKLLRLGSIYDFQQVPRYHLR